MLTPAEAARLIVDHCAPLPAERRPLKEALDLVLAEDVTSPIDLPGWDNSAMDGYAVRAADVAGATRDRRKTLRIVETVPAGRFPEQPLGPGAATRIFTGAPLPPGADSVIRQEDTEALAEGRVVNETINLAYGDGNSLVHAAELIAGELGVEPKIALAPSLLGEVTHYIADLTKARELLGYEPSVPLDEGISRAVAWFKEHRAAHPEEDGPLPADVLFPQDADIGWKSGSPVSS